MKIGILYQDHQKQNIPWQKHQEIYTRTANRVTQMSTALNKMGYHTIIYHSLNDFFYRNSNDNVDLIFPCIECCFERNTNGFIPAILQMKQIPFVGNDSYIYTIASDKYLFEKIAHSQGIRIPNSQLIYGYDYLDSNDKIKFPCILKYQYGSMSYHTAKIYDIQQFKKHIQFMIKQNCGPVLCEEYIEGHELSVPIIGNSMNEKILAVIEYTDSENNPIDVYDEFWKGKNDANVYLHSLSHSLPGIKEIINSVHQLYNSLGYLDYARFDFRLDFKGVPYLLEGNPLPALAYESAFDPLSYGESDSFDQILNRIVQNAIKRYGFI